MGPGVGGEGGEAFDGFDVGGVVVAHDGAGAGEEATGMGDQSFRGGGGEVLGVGIGRLEGVTYAKWEAFSSTFSLSRFFMATALSMMVADPSTSGRRRRGWLILLRTRDCAVSGKWRLKIWIPGTGDCSSSIQGF